MKKTCGSGLWAGDGIAASVCPAISQGEETPRDAFMNKELAIQ
jgi:hypothetical protein